MHNSSRPSITTNCHKVKASQIAPSSVVVVGRAVLRQALEEGRMQVTARVGAQNHAVVVKIKGKKQRKAMIARLAEKERDHHTGAEVPTMT